MDVISRLFTRSDRRFALEDCRKTVIDRSRRSRKTAYPSSYNLWYIDWVSRSAAAAEYHSRIGKAASCPAQSRWRRVRRRLLSTNGQRLSRPSGIGMAVKARRTSDGIVRYPFRAKSDCGEVRAQTAQPAIIGVIFITQAASWGYRGYTLRLRPMARSTQSFPARARSRFHRLSHPASVVAR